MAGANAIRGLLLLDAIVAAACGDTETQAPTATNPAGLYGDLYVADMADGAVTRLTRTRLHRDFDPSWQALAAGSS